MTLPHFHQRVAGALAELEWAVLSETRMGELDELRRTAKRLRERAAHIEDLALQRADALMTDKGEAS